MLIIVTQFNNIMWVLKWINGIPNVRIFSKVQCIQTAHRPAMSLVSVLFAKWTKAQIGRYLSTWIQIWMFKYSFQRKYTTSVWRVHKISWSAWLYTSDQVTLILSCINKAYYEHHSNLTGSFHYDTLRIFASCH